MNQYCLSDARLSSYGSFGRAVLPSAHGLDSLPLWIETSAPHVGRCLEQDEMRTSIEPNMKRQLGRVKLLGRVSHLLT